MSRASRHPSEIGFATEEFRRCPYEFYEGMRREEPVYHVPGHDAYFLSRWQDIVQVAHHPEVFAADAGEAGQGVSRAELLARFGIADGEVEFSPFIFARCDGAEHRLKRSIARSIVSRERLAAITPFVERTANELIDAFADRGECEFGSEYSAPIPHLAICELMGLDPSRTDLFMRISQNSAPGSLARFLSSDVQQARRADAEETFAYLRGEVEQRHASPGRADFLGEFVAEHVERAGGELDELLLTYLTTEAFTLLFGGLVTTQHLITNAMWLLLQNPGEHARVVADPSLVRPMLEETLRMEAPFYITEVRATEEVEVDGVVIPADASVYKIWASGNRDPERFEAPDAFRVGRPDVAKHHLGFGRGAHLCIGAPLARLEGEIAFRVLLTRLRNIRASPLNDFDPIDNLGFRSVKKLYLEFEAS